MATKTTKEQEAEKKKKRQEEQHRMMMIAEEEKKRMEEEEAEKKKKMQEERHRMMMEEENKKRMEEEKKRKRKQDEALFIFYKAESEAQQKEDEENIVNINSQIPTKTETLSIAKRIIYSDIDGIFGDISMSHNELQILSRKLNLLQIETKKRRLHEIVKCIKITTFAIIWNAWSRSIDSFPYSLIQIAFKYYQYVGILCSWQKKEKMIDRYPGGYDEYNEYTLWFIHSDGKMYEENDASSYIREDIKRSNMTKQLSTKQTELLITYLICYQLDHTKNYGRNTFKNYGNKIAEWYGLNITHYKYDHYKMGKELFLFCKNELKIDIPNNFE